MIAIVDYGMGNLRSVEKAFEHVGAQPEITRDHARIRAAAGVVLPGVGAFPRAMEAIREHGLDEVIRERAGAGVPLLGICLGMQLLFERSTELGGAEGIGLLPGEVRQLDAPGLKIPQIGWNTVTWEHESELTRGLSNPTAFYHVHSFGARDRRVRRALRQRGRGRGRLRSPVPPGEVGPGRPGAAPQLHRAGPVILLPAVDIRDGKAVRLVQGDFARETVYNDDPLDAAVAWVEQGARALHVVDLDGAVQGKPANLEHLRRICAAVEVPVQFGGGLRDSRAVRDALAAGADRVVIGTAAYTDVEFLDDVVQTWPKRVVVAVDVRAGHVSVAGWTKETQGDPPGVIERLQRRGVTQFAYTDVDRDGTLEGPDIEQVKRIGAVVRGRFVYSGGIGTLEHLRALAETRLVNLAGVIAGKSLYEGKFTIAEAHEALDG